MVLSGSFALVAAATVPLLVDTLPPEAQQVPLPLPVFCVLLAVQAFVVYGLLALGGLRMARRRGLLPAPVFTGVWTGRPRRFRPLLAAFGAGVLGGLALVGAVWLIRRYAPGSLPEVLHPPTLPTALLASTAASVGEEVMFRLFLVSLLLMALPRSFVGAALAVCGAAVLFGAAHTPGFVYIYGGLEHVPGAAWAWVIGLNAMVGVLYGALFIRSGVECAIVAHFGTDLVWHVATQML